MLLTRVLDHKHMQHTVYIYLAQHAACDMPGTDDVVFCNVNTLVYIFTTREVYVQTLMVLQMG